MLEQGPRYTAADFKHDELDYWFNAGLTNKLDTNPQTFRRTSQDVARRVTDFPAAWYAPMVGGSSNHFTANYWRFHEVDFNERSLIGDDPRHDVRRLADHVCGTGAVLYEGGMGHRRLRTRRREPVRSAAQQALPDAAAAGEILGRAARARRPQARLSSVSCADGDRVAAVSRPPRLRALRFLHRFRLRDARQVVDALHGDSRSRGDRALRGAQRQLRRSHRDQRRGSHDGRDLLRHGQARALPACACRRRLRERRRDGAPAADVGQLKVPRRPRQFERHGRQEPDVQHVRAKCTRSSSTS